MNAVQKLAALFADFPGIGPRQAKRFVYFLLTKNQPYLDELAKRIAEAKSGVSVCGECFRFFNKKDSNGNVCEICTGSHRNPAILMIVSRDADVEHMEKTGAFEGLYFVLGGSVPILEAEPEKRIRLKELLHVIEKKVKGGLREIVLAMSANSEGEHTSDYLKRVLSPVAQQHGFSISTLGRGLSTGTELEYSDSETLKNALKNRQ